MVAHKLKFSHTMVSCESSAGTLAHHGMWKPLYERLQIHECDLCVHVIVCPYVMTVSASVPMSPCMVVSMRVSMNDPAPTHMQGGECMNTHTCVCM